MKQVPQIARTRAALIMLIILATISLGAACIRRSRNNLRVAPTKEPVAEDSFRINLNTASADELEKLPGIGKVMAERIVAYREQYGPFKRQEHLMMVRGISPEKFRAIRSRVTVE